MDSSDAIADRERRRKALLAVGLDPDIIFAAEDAPPAQSRAEWLIEDDAKHAKPSKQRTISPERLAAARPTAVRELDDDEWRLIADLVPQVPQARLDSRDYVNTLLRVVVAGESWLSAQGSADAVRERRRRDRASPERMALWQEIEQLARVYYTEPMRSWMVRTARFARGDYSVRARRPIQKRHVSKFGASGEPVPARQKRGE